MNKIHERRLLKAAEIVEKADRYEQSLFYHFCGAPACVLGHYQVATKEITRSEVLDCGVEVAEHFGLSFGDLNDLFGIIGCNRAKTGKEAAKYIRDFVKRKRSAS